ncbi:hypothetical protein ACIGW8_22340 [Streptomyces sioyaensis]|uniref:hypothetical protein n=1 Tax=Streptomyces sioyaensis TaxID=67364 RepID=UPI0037CD534B
MNTRLINSTADLICRTMQTHRTPSGIAAALDAAGMLQSPESAAELASLRVMYEAGRRRRSRLARSVAGLRARVAELEQQAPAEVSPWQRAVDGLNALVDAGIGFHVEPDGHISNPAGDEHIEWDRAAERWRLVHDDADAEPEHPAPCRWPASPDCTCLSSAAASVAKLRDTVGPSGPPEPYACGLCGHPEDLVHGTRPTPGGGTHRWTQPAAELVKARMRDRAAAARAAGGERP